MILSFFLLLFRILHACKPSLNTDDLYCIGPIFALPFVLCGRREITQENSWKDQELLRGHALNAYDIYREAKGIYFYGHLLWLGMDDFGWNAVLWNEPVEPVHRGNTSQVIQSRCYWLTPWISTLLFYTHKSRYDVRPSSLDCSFSVSLYAEIWILLRWGEMRGNLGRTHWLSMISASIASWEFWEKRSVRVSTKGVVEGMLWSLWKRAGWGNGVTNKAGRYSRLG